MTQYEYDVCLSFAGEQRTYVEAVAAGLRAAGIKIFYDDYETVDLLGKDLAIHLDEVYRLRSAYCVVFVSAEYVEKRWTNHELRSALARALDDLGDYILPIRFDDTDVPGLRPTIGYIDAAAVSPRQLVDIVRAKVRSTATPSPRRRSRTGRTLSAEDLTILHPELAVAELADYDVQDTARLLASTEPGTAADVLAVADADAVLSILSTMHPRRAEQIVARLPLPVQRTFQHIVPAAASVSECRRQFRAQLGEPLSALMAESSQQRSGYRRDFEHGVVYWTEGLGAQPIWRAVAEYYRAQNGPSGRLGFPVTPEEAAPTSPQGSTGVLQRFESDSPYGGWASASRAGATVYWSEQHGAHSIYGRIGAQYENLGGTGGELGFPVSDEVPLRLPERSVDASYQVFEGGAIFWSSTAGCVIAPASLLKTFQDVADQDYFFPTGPAQPVRSRFGTSGIRQSFRLVRAAGSSGLPSLITAFSSTQGFGVTQEPMDELYRELGGVAGQLGFPVSDNEAREGQRFEGGIIYFVGPDESPTAVAVVPPVFDLVRELSVAEALGKPLSAAETFAGRPGLVLQMFERGLVTVREKVAEYWLRPD